MRAAIGIFFLLSTAAEIASAQTTPHHKPDPDRLGMTCAAILKMTSTEWITYFGEKTQSAAADKAASVARATAVYGKCYDARTDSLAASLAKSGNGPSKAARADFAGFEAALKSFSAKALADAQPAADEQKRALSALYEKQFRYDFCDRYEPKILAPTDAPVKSMTSLGKVTPPKNSEVPPSAPGTSPPKTPVETDELGKAKNRFGELIGVLPDEKLHELHAAFGAILGLHQVDDATTLAVYRYAIFLLEPSSLQSSYPPAF
jgi:hypothetical protein